MRKRVDALSWVDELRQLILFAVLIILALPPLNNASALDSYVMVGGQSGTWFEHGQNPMLLKIFLSNSSITRLMAVQSEGTVWTGGWNGSQWLISGWGTDPGAEGSDPYLFIYNGEGQVAAGSLDQYASEASWHGGDVFAVSYNGKYWLLSGMGSDTLPGFYSNQPVNHMALATFDGYKFNDLSARVPDQQADAILYSNAWNGTHWMIGGGYDGLGILFAFDGKNIVDLTDRIAQSVTSFSSVQTIRWNGHYWLIGGVGFLARFDGHNFVDLTEQLQSVFQTHPTGTTLPIEQAPIMGTLRRPFPLIVNAIAWNGSTWMLGGGAPVAQRTPNVAWLASYEGNVFVDLSSSLPKYVGQPQYVGSSILSICATDTGWIVGGYSDNHAVLLQYENGLILDISPFVSNMEYVIWVATDGA